MLPRRIALGIFLLTSLVAYWAQPAVASNWPRFRGPNGTGISSDKNVPVEWNKDAVLWKAAIPGVGNSSPVVWHRRVFLQSATTDGKARLLLCLDANDGKVIWTKSVPGSRTHINERNTFASSTPATDGQRVYAVFWDGNNVEMYAYDFDGHPLWHRDLGSFTSQHGAGASPIVCEDKVILANDQDGSSEVIALKAKSGKVAWRAPRKAFRACYSTPFVLEKPGKEKQLIVASTAGITSYNPQDGSENWNWGWTFSGMPLRIVASPLYSDDMIFANSGVGKEQRHMVAVRPGEHGKATKVWEKKRDLPYVPTMLAWGKYLYWVNDLGLAGCLVAKTGKSVWTERLGEPMTASPILIAGRIYAMSEPGTVYVFAAGPSFKLLAKNSLGEQVMASPAVADNRLFIRGNEHLFCIAQPKKKISKKD